MSIERKPMSSTRHLLRPGPVASALAALLLLAASPAVAELVVSQLIVEFTPGSSRANDIEIFNNSDERAYALVEPREILNPGTAAEQRFTSPDPAKLGLITSPGRFILEPRQRRTLRIAAIGAAADRERVYRVTVKPVTGEIASEESGLKLLVGYDLLILVRPTLIKNDVRVSRTGLDLTMTNGGNASVELAEGKQCDEGGKNCKSLPSKRLYAGASWKQTLPRPANGEYRVRSAYGWTTVKF
jgi:P pilus assembly chaperone PapD